MRAATAISVAFIGMVALLEKGQDALPHPNPAEHWRDELEGETWIIESTRKALQADRRKLDRLLESREARLREERLRWESVGHDRDGARSMARTFLEWEVQRLRSKIDTDEGLLHQSCTDYRRYARELADEAPGPPRTPPAACSDLTR